MTWQLIVHHDEEMRELLVDVVRKALCGPQQQPKIVEVRNILRARQAISDFKLDLCSLVVIGSTMPEHERASVGQTGREPSRQFIKEIKDQWSRLPLVVVSNTPDEHLAGFLDAFDRTALVTVDSQLSATLLDRVRMLHGGEGRRSSACLQLDIDLRSEHSAEWQLRRTGSDEFETSGTLSLDTQRLQRVLRESARLDRDVAGGSPDWLKSLGDLSDELGALLFYGGVPNFSCWETFTQLRDRVGGIAHTRVRVTVNDKTHPLLVEALKDREAPTDDYWILRAPVYRRYAQTTAYPPLFKDRASRNGPIDCLIIEADGRPGNVPMDGRAALPFAGLSHCEAEATTIEDILKANAGGQVTRLRMAVNDGRPLAQRVLETLDQRRWHVVHFCGHVSGDDRSEAGIVLRADRGGILPIKTLVKHLAQTQLLFMSSCRSASTKVVMQAVEQHVPAVLGFQWVVDDQNASNFARSFYRLLFDRNASGYRYLEYAFMMARKVAYDDARLEADRRALRPGESTTLEDVGCETLDASWVSPVLVMQMG
jgi:DNA-binding NarL/FixJ family response regulator